MSPRLAFVAPPARESDAVWSWLRERRELGPQRYDPRDLRAALRDADVIWLHAASPLPELPLERLHAFVTGGRGLLLTLRAAELVGSMGLEAVPPNDVADARWSHESDELYEAGSHAMPSHPHVRGIACYGPHPLVAGLHHGTYTWAPSEGEPYARACYKNGERPVDGRVVGVERAYVVQNPDRVVAWEYAVGRGRVVCVGAFVYFAAPDGLQRPQLERLVLNAIEAAVSHAEGGDRTYWPQPGSYAAPSEALVLPALLDFEGALPDPDEDPIVLEGHVEADEPFDLAGRRLLLVGRERLGIAEIWIHPHRVVSSWEVCVDGEPAHGTRIVVAPDVVVRTLETSTRRLTETAFVALEHAAAVVEYRPARRGRESLGREPAALEVTFTMDLRRMWPFAAGCGGNLRFRRSPQGIALVESESGDGIAAVFTNRPASLIMEPRHQGGAPAVQCTVAAQLGFPLRLAVVGGADRDDFERTRLALHRLGVLGLVRQRSQRALTVREARLAVRAGTEKLPRAVEWAKRRLDAFLVDAPGVGRSLAAGYAASTAGSGDGRPGYAWFFGRDACWSAFALLTAGEFSVARQVIRFLGDRQDVNGKVLHEATTSGQFHYDAADATPLYLLLVARYLAWSGDRDFVSSVWPHVLRAHAFCLGTDADGDGLIENAGVGHGWIESGPLAGARVTLYLAAIWRAALEGLARTAEVLGEARFAAECWAQAARAGAAIESDFYDEERGGYALDRRPDGARSWTQTALHAVPVLLGAANPVRAKPFLDALAGEGFSAPWGVRLLPTGDPHFNPKGYHSGAVWPLFTGWAALAEYRAGRGGAAFRHLDANLRLAFARQRGAFDEVLHGLEERAAGVCPNQAWSAAMVIAPLVEGLLGAVPDAPGGKLTIAPQLPEETSWLEIVGLRCGESVLDLKISRRASVLAVAARRAMGPPLWLTVAPWCEVVPSRVEADGQLVKPDLSPWGAGNRSAVSFQASAEHEVRFTLE